MSATTLAGGSDELAFRRSWVERLGMPVVAGMTDGCAAQLGSGALQTGSWNCVLGTTLVLKGVTEQVVQDPLGLVYCHRGPAGAWLPGGASSSGAGALTRELPGAAFDALTAEVAGQTPAAVAYPLAGERGERFPLRAPELTPFVLGTANSDAEMFHAVLAGVACVERLCFDYLDLLDVPTDGLLTFTGGGATNPYWCRLRASILGRAARVPENAGSALGMAMLATAAHGRSLADAAKSMVGSHSEIEPDLPASPLLDLYARFVDHLSARHWVDPDLAWHAHRRAGR
ncbi:MAG: FGGY-family carbohydrate kinase [Thermocrispum sp.]